MLPLKQFRLFIWAYVINIIAMTLFLVQYIVGFVDFMQKGIAASFTNQDGMPFEYFKFLFSPTLIIAIVVAFFAGMLYRVLGIVLVAGNKKIEGGEQAMWIIGFVLFGFIAAIVFMALAKSRGLIPVAELKTDNTHKYG